MEPSAVRRAKVSLWVLVTVLVAAPLGMILLRLTSRANSSGCRRAIHATRFVTTPAAPPEYAAAMDSLIDWLVSNGFEQVDDPRPLLPRGSSALHSFAPRPPGLTWYAGSHEDADPILVAPCLYSEGPPPGSAGTHSHHFTVLVVWDYSGRRSAVKSARESVDQFAAKLSEWWEARGTK